MIYLIINYIATHLTKFQQNHTLLRYLVDKLEAAEESHAHTLCPTAKDFQTSLMGKHIEFAPATNGEIRSMHSSIQSTMCTGLDVIH